MDVVKQARVNTNPNRTLSEFSNKMAYLMNLQGPSFREAIYVT